MSEIGLQDLIYQVKRELLATNRQELARDPYPLFVIDKIDLEISVNVSKSRQDGIKLTVLNFAEIGSSRADQTSRGHVVKISLSSLLSREALLQEALRDPEKRKRIFQQSVQAFTKGDDADFRE
jgi:hypothetical protein